MLLDKLSLAFYPWTLDQYLQRRYWHGKVPQQVSGNIDIVMTEWALGF